MNILVFLCLLHNDFVDDRPANGGKWNRKHRNGCDIVINSHVLNHGQTQHHPTLPKWMWTSSTQTQQKNFAANSELKDWCCPVMVFIVSEFGLINIFSGYIMEIYVRARANPKTPAQWRLEMSHWNLMARSHQSRVWILNAIGIGAPTPTGNRGMHSASTRSCSVDLSIEINKLNNSLLHSMFGSTAESVECVHFFLCALSSVCSAARLAGLFYSLHDWFIWWLLLFCSHSEHIHRLVMLFNFHFTSDIWSEALSDYQFTIQNPHHHRTCFEINDFSHIHFIVFSHTRNSVVLLIRPIMFAKCHCHY